VKKASQSSAAILIAIAISLTTFDCRRQTRQDNVMNKDKGDSIIVESYSREGFIGNNTYRVVIVQPEGTPAPGPAEITDLAKKRALQSMKNYLSSRNAILTPNHTAALLDIVQHSGKLSNVETDSSNSRKVFYFEVERDNLRNYLNELAKKR